MTSEPSLLRTPRRLGSHGGAGRKRESSVRLTDKQGHRRVTTGTVGREWGPRPTRAKNVTGSAMQVWL